MNLITTKDCWARIKSAGKPICMYGMGNGADKIIRVLDSIGVTVDDFFASDGFVRGHSFHGKTVLSYSEIKEKYGAENIIILISFGSSLPNVLSLFKSVNDECETYAPDVPVCDIELFTYEFFNKNKEKIEKVYSLLADDTSKKIYENVINYKLSGNIDYLFKAETDKDETYSLLCAEKFEYVADLGAYNGDTVREILEYSPNVKAITAFEPDRRNFKKLSQYCESIQDRIAINALNAAAWSSDTTLLFGGEGNRNSGVFAPSKTAKTVEVDARSLDSALSGSRVDYIKYDVEGAEREAIEGSLDTILSYRPALLVSAYHKSEDIFSLPLQIHELRPDYKLYYRRYPYVPAWDLNLICI